VNRLRGVRALAVVAAVTTYALIVLGALVRSTNSGLSCPDWPTCYGQWVLTPGDFAALPATGYSYGQVMLEWAHRLIAGVVLGPLVLVLASLAFIRRRADRALAIAGGVLLFLLLVQGVLGGITVLDQNSPWSVALHLGNALLVLTSLLWITVRTSPALAAEPVRPRPGALGVLAGLAWVLALAAMVTAAVTAKSGASLACATWPLCNGAVVPDLGDPLVRIHFTHRVLAAAVGVALLLLFVASRRAAPALRRLAGLAFLMVIVEIGLGALVVLWQVPIWKAVLHQAVGVATFAVVTVLFWVALVAPSAGRAGQQAGMGEDDGLALQRA
jgi:cytochrome c oxidase assembly protein subunit 15